MTIARIIPSTVVRDETEPPGTRFVPTQGTVVMVGGEKLSGITKIVVTFEPNNVVTASIECLASMEGVDALIESVTKAKPKFDANGVEDVTHLGSTHSEFAQQ